MGRAIKYRIVRFLESDFAALEESARDLLCGFRSQVGAICIAGDEVKWQDAVDIIPKQLVSLPPIFDGGTGLTFNVDNTEKSRWHLVLIRDVFFRLELRSHIDDSSKFDRTQGQSIVNSGTAHIFQNSLGIYGSAADIYLILKLQNFRRRHIRVHSSEGGLFKGQMFRQTCHKRWSRAHRENSPIALPSWGWQTNRLHRQFDKLLIDTVDEGELNAAFKEMAIDPELWFEK